jgi:hypothetical protein
MSTTKVAEPQGKSYMNERENILGACAYYNEEQEGKIVGYIYTLGIWQGGG